MYSLVDSLVNHHVMVEDLLTDSVMRFLVLVFVLLFSE